MKKLLSLIIVSLFVMFLSGGLVFADSNYTYENVTILGSEMGGTGQTPPVEAIRVTIGSYDPAIAVGDVMAWGIQPQYTDGNALGIMVEKNARDEHSTALSVGTYGYGPYAGVMLTIVTSGDTSAVSGKGWANSNPLQPQHALGFMAIRGFVDAKIDVSHAALGEHLAMRGGTLAGSFGTWETIKSDGGLSSDVGVLLELKSADGLAKVWLR